MAMSFDNNKNLLIAYQKKKKKNLLIGSRLE